MVKPIEMTLFMPPMRILVDFKLIYLLVSLKVLHNMKGFLERWERGKGGRDNMDCNKGLGV